MSAEKIIKNIKDSFDAYLKNTGLAIKAQKELQKIQAFDPEGVFENIYFYLRNLRTLEENIKESSDTLNTLVGNFLNSWVEENSEVLNKLPQDKKEALLSYVEREMNNDIQGIHDTVEAAKSQMEKVKNSASWSWGEFFDQSREKVRNSEFENRFRGLNIKFASVQTSEEAIKLLEETNKKLEVLESEVNAWFKQLDNPQPSQVGSSFKEFTSDAQKHYGKLSQEIQSLKDGAKKFEQTTILNLIQGEFAKAAQVAVTDFSKKLNEVRSTIYTDKEQLENNHEKLDALKAEIAIFEKSIEDNIKATPGLERPFGIRREIEELKSRINNLVIGSVQAQFNTATTGTLSNFNKKLDEIKSTITDEAQLANNGEKLDALKAEISIFEKSIEDNIKATPGLERSDSLNRKMEKLKTGLDYLVTKFIEKKPEPERTQAQQVEAPQQAQPRREITEQDVEYPLWKLFKDNENSPDLDNRQKRIVEDACQIIENGIAAQGGGSDTTLMNLQGYMMSKQTVMKSSPKGDNVFENFCNLLKHAFKQILEKTCFRTAGNVTFWTQYKETKQGVQNDVNEKNKQEWEAFSNRMNPTRSSGE